MIIMEALEDFLSLLEKVDKQTPVYISKQKNMNDAMVMNGSLLWQVKYGDDVAQFTYTEHIDPVQMIPSTGIMQLSKILPSDLMDKINLTINEKINGFNKQLETEYGKAVEVCKQKGYLNILKATLI